MTSRWLERSSGRRILWCWDHLAFAQALVEIELRRWSRSPPRALRPPRLSSVGAWTWLLPLKSVLERATRIANREHCDRRCFRKRWTVSGEYQLKSAVMLRVMHPAKNWSQ